MVVKNSVVVEGTLVVTVMVRVGPVFMLTSRVGPAASVVLVFVLVFLSVAMLMGAGCLLSSTLTTTSDVFVAVVLDRIVWVLLNVDVIVSMILW